jgi:peptidoglycan/LPS O-acetylase OafA/YrhL
MITQAQPETAQRGRVTGTWRAATAAALFCIAAAALWDVLALLRAPADRAPGVTHTLLAVGIGSGCGAVLLRMLQRRRTEPRPAGTIAAIVALGLLLAVWLLRGHPGIPPDGPLIGAQLFGLALCLYAVRRGTRASTDA